MNRMTGDLLDLFDAGRFDVIIQGCNCKKTMKSGIAKQIAARYPQAVEIDNNFSPHRPEDRLGLFSRWQGPNPLSIGYNAYTQLGWRQYQGEVVVDYGALTHALAGVRLDIQSQAEQGYLPSIEHLNIGYPLIGAGLAGGDWNQIKRIIDIVFRDVEFNHSLVVLPE